MKDPIRKDLVLKTYDEETDCEVESFADDTIVYVSGKDENTTVAVLNSTLEKVSEWFTSQSLPLNEKKSVAMLVRGGRKKAAGDCCVKVNGVELPWSDSTWYLGVTVDHHLSWKE